MSDLRRRGAAAASPRRLPAPPSLGRSLPDSPALQMEESKKAVKEVPAGTIKENSKKRQAAETADPEELSETSPGGTKRLRTAVGAALRGVGMSSIGQMLAGASGA